VQQLDDVEGYYRNWMATLHIDKFRSPIDFYLVTRGPGGLKKENYNNDDYPMGMVQNPITKVRYMSKLGEVRTAYWNIMNGFYGWTKDKYPGKGDAPDESSGAEGPWDMPDFMKWTPGRRRVQTTAVGVNVRSGPGVRFPVVRTLMAVGARFALLDVVAGDSVNGNTDWFKVGPNEFISGTLMAVSD
jgi:hypothetical protein